MRERPPRERVAQPGPVFGGPVADGHRQWRLRAGLEEVTGKLAAGLAADIMVFRKRTDYPFDDLLRTTAQEVLATFVDGRLRSGNREGFSGALPDSCRFTVGAHFVCAELPDAASGLPFGFEEVLRANQKKISCRSIVKTINPFPTRRSAPCGHAHPCSREQSD